MRPVAEQIAEVVADIRADRVTCPMPRGEQSMRVFVTCVQRAQLPQPVVDCTSIFHIQRAAEEVSLYEDHPQITPPWENSLLCYVNTFGNVCCLQVWRQDWDGTRPAGEDWYTDNDVDWSQVRWVVQSAVFIGGVSGDGRPMPTSGPCHLFRHAVNADGSIADINWVALLAPAGQRVEHADFVDKNQAVWDAAMITLGASLNFLNASNVSIAEPARPRPERRRIARTGVEVQTIVIRPPGKRRATSTAPRPLAAGESVLSPVRGHFAHYGPDYGKGLLFGKYAGKFYIPSHVRGEGDAAPKDYVLAPGGAS